MWLVWKKEKTPRPPCREGGVFSIGVETYRLLDDLLAVLMLEGVDILAGAETESVAA